MTCAELLDNLDRHFIVGNPRLSSPQFREHAARGSCTQCDELAGQARASLGVTAGAP